MARPYRVGMQRPPQRYIAPDEIYDDLRTTPTVSMPSQFPYTWTPVNGLGSTDGFGAASVGDQFLDLIKNVGTGVVRDGKKVVENNVATGAEDFLRSGPGRALLVAVEQKAAQGVTKVVKQQAPNLMLLAVAGGAVGGAISQKLGKAGTIGALAIALWAGKQLLDAGKDVK